MLSIVHVMVKEYFIVGKINRVYGNSGDQIVVHVKSYSFGINNKIYKH